MKAEYLGFRRKKTSSKSEGITIYTDEVFGPFSRYANGDTVILTMPDMNGKLHEIEFHFSRFGITLYTAKKNWPFALPTTDVSDGMLYFPVLKVEIK